MSWLNTSLSSLKGQLSSLAADVLAEGAGAPVGDGGGAGPQEEEIASLRKLNDELQTALQAERLSRQNGVAKHEEESSWFWDPPTHSNQHHSRDPTQTEGEPGPPRKDDEYRKQIQALQDEVSHLKQLRHEKSNAVVKQGDDNVEGELKRLRDENSNLTTNLEDLDSQHQIAMEKLLMLKKELHKNFEVLKLEHEDLKLANEEFSKEVGELKSKLVEKDKDIIKGLEKIETSKIEYETLQHKYQNLERVHSVLRETAEKFQEENQELHEEVFKLQEEISKHQDGDLHNHTKHSQITDMIPRNKYEELLKELMLLQETRRSTDSLHLDETNIDDNAKSVIENLKRDISDLKHKLSQKTEHIDLSDPSPSHARLLDTDKLSQIYNKYVTFELPVDYVGEIPSTGVSNLIYKIENALKSLNTFKKQLEVLEQQISEKTINQKHLQSQIDELTSENDFLTSDLSQCETELSEMKKNNDFLLTEIAALKNASKLEPIIESPEDNIVKLESELADCTEMNNRFQVEIGHINSQLLELRRDKLVLHSDLHDLRDRYNHMLLELDSYKTKEIAVKQLELDTQVDNSDRLRKALDEIDELKRKLHTTASKNEQLKIDYSIIDNEKVLLTNHLDNMKHELNEKINSHKEAAAMKIALEHKLHDLEKKVEGLVKDKTEVENDREILIEKLKTLTKQTQDLAHDNECISKLKMVEQDSDKYFSEIEIKLQLYKTTEKELRSKIEELESYNNKVNDQVITLTKNNGALLEKIESLSSDLKTCKSKENELTLEVDDLKLKLTNNSNTSLVEEEISMLKSKLADHEIGAKELDGLRQDKHHLLEIKKQLENDLALTDERLTTLDVKFEQLLADMKTKDDEIEHLNGTLNAIKENSKTLNETISSLQNAIDIKDQEINHLNDTTIKLNTNIQEFREKSTKQDMNATQIITSEQINEKESLVSQISELNNNLTVKKKELDEAKVYIEALNKAQIENQTLLDNITKEKAELINFITVKHNENIQYHNEIQRLNQVILEQTAEYKRVLDEKDVLSHQSVQNCTECEKVKTSLKEKDEKFMELNEQINATDSTKVDLSHATDLIRNLTDKCEELDKNLTIQVDMVKKLTTENVQLSERESNLSRELERLREHLLETEEHYTVELTQEQQRLAECQGKLQAIEERAKQSSTVYTSNSIRANQEVETLRNQIRLLERQREEAQARLGEAEDGNCKSKAALGNLQVVLEQFQMDKEREVHAATEKVRGRTDDLRRVNEGLRAEIQQLAGKLEEATRGLKAAARLGDQLETKAAQIDEYREQVRALQEAARASEERYQSVSRQRDRVDKSLVKNLFINYVQAAVSARNDRVQILRILSSVLDFDQWECEKVGLSKQGGAAGGDSLAREFVRFLEKESRPTVPLPNMMGLTQHGSDPSSRSATPLSRKNSGLGPPPTPHELYGHSRTPSGGSNNLLFQSIGSLEPPRVSLDASGHAGTPPGLPGHPSPPSDLGSHSVLENTGVNQTRNNEGTILKHVLKDF